MLTKRVFLTLAACVLALPVTAADLTGLSVYVTSQPAGEPIAPITIDSDHAKAFSQMGPVQAGPLMADILSPKLEELTGVSGKSWNWVLMNHLKLEVTNIVIKGGETALGGLQFAEQGGEPVWAIRIVGETE